MKVVFEPTSKHLKQIENWLFEEKNKGISRTYYNFINADFSNNNFVCLLDEINNAIGYIQYTYSGSFSSIDIAIIRNEYQKKGFGKLLLEKLTMDLVERGSLVLKLFCEPHSSKIIWKKLGFLEFKEIENHGRLNSKDYYSPWLYKPIVPILKPTKKKKITKKVELWTELEYKIKNNERASYVWDVTTYIAPIVYPIDYEWKLRYSINDKVIYEGVVKNFFNGVFSLGDFLIIIKK